MPAGLASYQSSVYGYSVLYPSGWAIVQSDPALVTITGPGSSSIVVDYDLDSSRSDVTAYKVAKLQAFQAAVSGFTTVSEARDAATQTWKVEATYTQGGVAKRAFLYVDYPKPRGFMIVLAAATADFDGLRERFNQVLAGWQAPAIVK